MEADRSSTVCDDELGEDTYFSDESSFYGGDEVEVSFEERAAYFDPTQFWDKYPVGLQCIAADNSKDRNIPKDEELEFKVKTEEAAKPTTQSNSPKTLKPDPGPLTLLPNLPYNPYEGDEMAKQLSEPLASFLARLKPSSTTIEQGAWIWIANPSSTHRATDPYIAGFKEAGSALLSEYMRRKRKLEEANPNMTPGVVTRVLKADRAWLEEEIVSLAKAMNVTSGKWMLFPYPNRVDEMWAKVATATLEGTLGSAAKVATDDGSDKPERLMCVYTDNFSDKEDLRRVLLEMKRLGLVRDGEEDRSIYYKCDAYTYLDIVSGNDYKLKASMYNSRDMFKEMVEK